MPATVVSQTGVAPARVVSPAPSLVWRAVSGAQVSAPPIEVSAAAQSGTAVLGVAGRGAGAKIAAQAGGIALVLDTLGGDTAAALLPPSFTHITVTRDYDLATGSAPTGTVSFTPSEWLTNRGVTVVAAAIAVPLDAAGKISVSLVANTDPATQPTGSYYLVQEDIVGQPRRLYKLRIPHDLGTPVDLAGFVASYPASPLTGYGLGGYGTSGYGV